MEDSTTSKKPYFIRAMFEWISDNGYTPHLLIDASFENMSIPRKFVENERITLNISSSATRNLTIDSDMISFDARFEGKTLTAVMLAVPDPGPRGIFAFLTFLNQKI